MEGIPSPTGRDPLEFHEERWKKEAENSGWLRPHTKEQRMLIEADRDNADFDRRQTPEFQAWEKSLIPVVRNFKERAENPESDRKTLLFIMGGGMKAAYAAGQVSAMNEVGITADKVDIVVGASAGAVVATAYAGGPEQTERGIEMMCGPLSSKEFIDTKNPRRIYNKNVINLALAQNLMEGGQGGQYAIDEEAVHRSLTELHYVVTEPAVDSSPLRVRFLDAKKLPSMTDGITATMSLPSLTGPIPVIDEQQVLLDGALSPLPIFDIIREFPGVTDILILPQNPYKPNDKLEPHVLSKIFSQLLQITPLGNIAKLHQMEKYLMASKTRREMLEFIQQITGVRIGVMWPPDDDLYTTNIDGDRAAAAVIASKRNALRVFRAASSNNLEGEQKSEAASQNESFDGYQIAS